MNTRPSLTVFSAVLSMLFLAGCAPDRKAQTHSNRSGAALSSITNAVPSATCKIPVYVIAKGDTVAKIARKFQISIEDFRALNPDVDMRQIRVGQKVRVYQDPQTPYLNGRAVAQMDIQSGRLMVRTYGLPVPWFALYASNLASRYHIELRPAAGDVVTDALLENVKGYNEISEAEIDRRYGPGLLQRVAKESEQAWLQRMPNR